MPWHSHNSLTKKPDLLVVQMLANIEENLKLVLVFQVDIYTYKLYWRKLTSYRAFVLTGFGSEKMEWWGNFSLDICDSWVHHCSTMSSDSFFLFLKIWFAISSTKK